MSQRVFLLKPLALALLSLGCSVAIAAPFGVPFIPLPEGSSGNNGDTSAYFGLQLDPNTFQPVYPPPNVYGCANSPTGDGSCRTDFNNFDTRYRYDSVRWRMYDGGRTPLIGDISWRDGGLDMFRKIYFGYAFDATAPGNVVPGLSQPINFVLYSENAGQNIPKTYRLTTESIVFDNVRLKLGDVSSNAAGAVDLVFDGDQQSIHLSNSSVLFGLGKLRVFPRSFSIHALSGQSSLEQFGNRTLIDAPTTISIAPGAWLTFSDFAEGLEFRGKSNALDAVGLNQDGGLVLQRGKFRFVNGQANFSQGATLRLVGSETQGTFDLMHFSSGAKIGMANGTLLEARRVELRGSAATMGSNASILTKSIEVIQSDNRISSEDYQARWGVVQTDYLGLFDGARLELNGLGDLKVKGRTDIGNGFANAGSGAVLNLNRADITVYDRVDMYNGAEMVLTDLARFIVRPDKGTHESPDAILRGVMAVGTAAGNPARIHVGPTALLSAVYGGQIDLNDDVLRVKVDRTGSLAVKGNLRGSGHIEGDGVVILEREGTAYGQKVSGGWLFPGTLNQPIATLSTDTALYFEGGSQLRVNVVKDGQGQLTYGQVLYGAGDVTLGGFVTLALAQVRGQAPLSAADLDGKSITLLSARDASVTGTILPSLYTPQIDVSAMPALLTWRLVDLQTNQHPDLTLQADLLPVTSLRNTTGIKTNRGSGLGLLVAAATQNASSPVAAALNTVTNAQLAASGGATGTPAPTPPVTPPNTPAPTPPVTSPGTPAPTPPVASPDRQNSWHPEPYSSYIATGLANIANLRNMVFEQALLTDFSGARAWADAAGFRGSIDGQDDLGGYSYRMSQLAVGKDMGDVLGGAWGAYFAATDQKIDEHDLLTQKISGTTLGVGAYWRQKGDTWTTLAQVGMARGEHDSSRQLSVGAYSGAARSRYNSQSLQAALRFSAPWFEFRGMEVSKELGGSISLYRQSGFDETGDDQFGFRIKSANAAAYIAHAGAHVRFPVLMGTVGLRPFATARLEHDFARNKDHGIEASLLANPGSYEEFVGQGRGANSAVLGLGLMSETLGPWQVQAGLTHAWHTHGRDWGAGIKVRYSW